MATLTWREIWPLDGDSGPGQPCRQRSFLRSYLGGQAQAAGQAFARAGIRFDRVIVSGLPRTVQMAETLTLLARQDPTFRAVVNEETGQTIISGMGELHLEIIVDRMMREFKVDANVGRPQVAYRETIRKSVQKVEGKFVRQSGGGIAIEIAKDKSVKD